MKNIFILVTGLMFLLSCADNNQSKGLKQVTESSDEYFLFISTNATADSNGIFVYRFSTVTGQPVFLSAIAGIEKPTFITISPDRRFLYAVSAVQGGDGGWVYAYAFDPTPGKLSFLNRQLSGGDGPCNVITDATGKWLFVSNYGGGSLSTLPIQDNGNLGPAIQTIQHQGHGADPGRQDKPHVHCISPAPNNREIFVADLGADKIFNYAFNPETGALAPGNPPHNDVVPGAGPRHSVFAPNGKYLYLLNELQGQISVFAYQSGQLTPIQITTDLPKDFSGRIWAADIHLSPDGKFLYASYRDDLNDIARYAVDDNTGELSFLGRTASEGKTPRNFLITPDGSYLLAGHQNSDKIVVFKRDIGTGELEQTIEGIDLPAAMCLKMIKID